ncbi:DUF3530 family protein [Marinobacterium weihaiense]|uniref:Alpha/beta hydrolase family protein n=1 Tax=Marinobacterium weihaiense TaxID=2851016 RepID=A0ABS6M9T6_9GAMM|nr:DUF3530 family protein [Marinobacterium weihaiense]MBV0933048.1 alpha/beta hydrolase family protein [Marinobacterium weihaiense]
MSADNRNMPTHALIFASLLCLSTLASAAEPERHGAGIPVPQARILQQLGLGHELIDVDIEGNRFRLLYRPAMTPKPSGAVLLLPDPGSAEAWLEQVRALTAYLPEHGWTVIAVEPPELPDSPVPTRTSPAADSASAPAAAEGSSATASGPTVLSFEQQMAQRLQEAHDTLGRRAPELRQRIITGIGRSAVWGVDWAQGKDDGVNLMLIDPRPSPGARQPLHTLLPLVGRRTLIDLYHAPMPGYPDAEPNARQRRLLARRADLKHYHQSRLPGVFRGWQGDMPWLTRHVRGLLERIILDDSRKLRGKMETPVPRVQAPPGSAAINASGGPT